MAFLSSNFYYNWDYWELDHKVTFFGIEKIIQINEGVTNVDVKRDIYSSWKEWASLQDNVKFPIAISAIGGEPITSTTAVGATYFLENGWRIRPWSGNYILTIDGNVYTREAGGAPTFAPEIKSTITISFNRSSLVDRVDLNPDVVQIDVNVLSQQISSLVWALGLTEAANTEGSIGDHITNKLLTVNKYLSLK